LERMPPPRHPSPLSSLSPHNVWKSIKRLLRMDIDPPFDALFRPELYQRSPSVCISTNILLIRDPTAFHIIEVTHLKFAGIVGHEFLLATAAYFDERFYFLAERSAVAIVKKVLGSSRNSSSRSLQTLEESSSTNVEVNRTAVTVTASDTCTFSKNRDELVNQARLRSIDQLEEKKNKKNKGAHVAPLGGATGSGGEPAPELPTTSSNELDHKKLILSESDWPNSGLKFLTILEAVSVNYSSYSLLSENCYFFAALALEVANRAFVGSTLEVSEGAKTGSPGTGFPTLQDNNRLEFQGKIAKVLRAYEVQYPEYDRKVCG